MWSPAARRGSFYRGHETRNARRFRIERFAVLCRDESDREICHRRNFSAAKWTRFPCSTRISSTRSISSPSCERCCRSAVLMWRKGEEDRADSKEIVDPWSAMCSNPAPEVVLDVMLPYYLQYQVFQMILDARASEHSARMVAMKNATDNANNSSRISRSNTTRCARPASRPSCSKSRPRKWRSALNHDL